MRRTTVVLTDAARPCRPVPPGASCRLVVPPDVGARRRLGECGLPRPDAACGRGVREGVRPVGDRRARRRVDVPRRVGGPAPAPVPRRGAGEVRRPLEWPLLGGEVAAGRPSPLLGLDGGGVKRVASLRDMVSLSLDVGIGGWPRLLLASDGGVATSRPVVRGTRVMGGDV